ncbi:MAG: S8 family peptidase, partial [Armatimonadota bacterium]
MPGLKTEWVRNPLTGRRDECVAGEVLVRFGAATRGAARDAVHRAIGARVLSRIPEIGVERVGCPDGLSVEETVAAYRGRAGVISAEPNYIVRALERQKRVPAFDGAATLAGRSRLIPNDPRFAEQYGLGNIEAPAAWDTATGCPEVVIAVLDTGVNLTHEDLQANIWQNLDETPNNGVDDDGNGKVDDRFGWDFVDNDNDPDTEDNSGNGDKHGTHVAGIAAAIGNNGVGVAGVVWQCKIMSVRVLNASGNGTNAGVMDGIVYAAQNGAHVINLSIGGGYSAAMQSAIDFAYDRDVVICVALGNDGEEITTSQSTWQSPVCNDGTPGVDNKILGVAAVDRFDIKPGWSNYSAAYSFCDVSAPGVDVLSTWWPSGYGIISGTSMATPHVAGLAAMLRCQFPSDTNAEIMARIRGSADNIDAANPAVAGKLGTGRINAFNALQPPQPGPIRFVSHDVDDDTQGTSDGDGDLLVEPGESIELSVTVRNQGMLQAQNVRATLTTTTPGITITDDSESFANVPAFATASTLDDFDFTVAPSVPLGSVINFELTAVADNGGPWVSQFSVRAGRGPDGE